MKIEIHCDQILSNPLSFGFVALLALTPPLLADDPPASPSSPKIIGPLLTDDTLLDRPSPARVSAKSPRIIFQRIAPPIPPSHAKISPTPPPKPSPPPEETTSPAIPAFDFTVEATSFPGQATHLKIWFQNQPYPFWSNLDWHHLQGLTGIEDQGQNFHFLLFIHAPKLDLSHSTQPQNQGTGNESLPKSEKTEKYKEENEKDLPKLPNLAGNGPYFTTTLEATETNKPIPAPVLNFLEAAHQLYLEREKELIAATEKRFLNRQKFHQKQLTTSSQNTPPRDLIIRYWRNDPKPLPSHVLTKDRKERR